MQRIILKRLATAVLMVAMVLAIALPAFASVSNTGSTINNTVVSQVARNDKGDLTCRKGNHVRHNVTHHKAKRLEHRGFNCR
jgi:hypothetical protein